MKYSSGSPLYLLQICRGDGAPVVGQAAEEVHLELVQVIKAFTASSDDRANVLLTIKVLASQHLAATRRQKSARLAAHLRHTPEQLVELVPFDLHLGVCLGHFFVDWHYGSGRKEGDMSAFFVLFSFCFDNGMGRQRKGKP